MNYRFVLSLLFGVATAAEGATYDYQSNGHDWPDDYDTCKGSNQSPIDLKTPDRDNSLTKQKFSTDKLGKQYTDQTTDIMIEWKGGHTTQVAVNKEGQDTQFFTSKIARDHYKHGFDEEVTESTEQEMGDIFRGVQFHFHAGSEHTVNGKRYDFEMHTVHLIDEAQADMSEFGFAAMGILFSVDDYTAKLTSSEQQIVDDFFDSLQLDQQDDPLVARVPYGKLMMMVDYTNRWVYKGSVTTPPCAKYVFWNVLSTVYPISQKHLDLFKAQLARGEHDLEETGNWREIQPLSGHDPIWVFNDRLEDEDDSTEGLVVGNIVLTSLAVGVLVISMCFMCYKQNEVETAKMKTHSELADLKLKTEKLESNLAANGANALTKKNDLDA